MTRRLLTAALIAPALAASVSAAEPKTVVLEQVQVKDKELGRSPACTLLKPKGWKVEGQVNWAPLTIHQANLEVTVSDPDSMHQYKTTPWTLYASDSGNALRKKRFDGYYYGLYCEPMWPTELHAAFFEAFAAQMPKGMKIAEQAELPEVAKVFAKSTGLKVQAGRTRMAYKVDGVAVEEDYYLVMYYTAAADGYGGTFRQMVPLVQPFSLRAEKGKLDAATPKLMAIAHSLQPTEALGVAMKKGLAGLMKGFYDEQAAIAEISRSISANNDAMIAMIRSERQSRWAREDVNAKKFSDYIRGVDSYTDGTSTYTIPYGYSQAWGNGSGTVILSNDTNYDPNRSERGNWNELKPVK